MDQTPEPVAEPAPPVAEPAPEPEPEASDAAEADDAAARKRAKNKAKKARQKVNAKGGKAAPAEPAPPAPGAPAPEPAAAPEPEVPEPAPQPEPEPEPEEEYELAPDPDRDENPIVDLGQFTHLRNAYFTYYAFLGWRIEGYNKRGAPPGPKALEWKIYYLSPPDSYFFDDDTTFEMVVGYPFLMLGFGHSDEESFKHPEELDDAFKREGVAGATKFMWKTDWEAMLKIITHPSYADKDVKAAILEGTYTIPEGCGNVSGRSVKLPAASGTVASLEALEAALADNPYVLQHRAKLSALKESDVETYRKRLALIQQQQGAPAPANGPPAKVLARLAAEREALLEKRRRKKEGPSFFFAAAADARDVATVAYGAIAVAVAAILFYLYQGLGA